MKTLCGFFRPMDFYRPRPPSINWKFKKEGDLESKCDADVQTQIDAVCFVPRPSASGKAESSSSKIREEGFDRENEGVQGGDLTEEEDKS